MDMDLVHKIANLTFASYYNPSIQRVVLHFFNKDEDKNDIIAYLNEDMSWDVREIIDETSELDNMAQDGFLGEDITISHERVGIFDKDSDFDKFVRGAITKMASSSKENDDTMDMIDGRVVKILESGSYSEGETSFSISEAKNLLN